jgi:hypothetical protein
MVKNPLWLLLIFFALTACHERPTFPNVPSISLNDYYFREIQNTSGGANLQDSIVIRLKFEDGDGDLGLDAIETSPPFQLYDVVLVGNDTLSYGDNDTLPDYNCFNYEILTKTISQGDSLVVKSDTIYVIRNLNHYNFFLTFLVEQSDGSFEEYNTYENLCAAPFHGRFFVLNTARDIRPLTGELQYGFISSFRLLFRNFRSIKMRFQIQDRNLRKSNIIETEPFDINEIVRPPL